MKSEEKTSEQSVEARTEIIHVGEGQPDNASPITVIDQRLDQNPAAIYLATLRPVGRRGMLRALNLIAEIASGGKHNAMTLAWPELRYQHTAAIAASLIERGYRPATVNQALSGLRSVLYHAWKLGIMESEDYQRARDVKNKRADSLPRGRCIGYQNDPR